MSPDSGSRTATTCTAIRGASSGTGATDLAARRGGRAGHRDALGDDAGPLGVRDRKSTRLNSSHQIISYAVFCLKKKNNDHRVDFEPPRNNDPDPEKINTPRANIIYVAHLSLMPTSHIVLARN